MAPSATITELAPRVARGEVRAERLVEEALAQITQRNPQLNAFITVTADEALAAARRADQEISAGRLLGPLHGIPISVKDLIDVVGTPTTAGSRLREEFQPTTNAPTVDQLLSAGAVIVGKTNLHEFAFGTTTEDSGWGPARNPFDPNRSPGGSSGGSAIAVQTGMSLASVGTDTGGSIRIPAAACGIVGLKPTWGEVSADGVVPLSRQLDHVGPLARSVDDAALMFHCLRGDISTRPLERTSIRNLRLGVIGGYFMDRLDEEVETGILNTIEALRRAGGTITEVTIAHAGDLAPIYLHLVLADAAAYHASSLNERPTAYTKNVRLRLEMGRYVLAEDYVRAQRGRAVLAAEVEYALRDVDALLLPALPIPAPPIGAPTVPVKGGAEPVRSAMLRCTQLFNVTGHPAISLPCGTTKAGLPIGLQVAGKRHRTDDLLMVARAIELTLQTSA